MRVDVDATLAPTWLADDVDAPDETGDGSVQRGWFVLGPLIDKAVDLSRGRQRISTRRSCRAVISKFCEPVADMCFEPGACDASPSSAEAAVAAHV